MALHERIEEEERTWPRRVGDWEIFFRDDYNNCDFSIGSELEKLEKKYLKFYKGLKKGDDGEEYVDEQLQIFGKKYRILKNIKLPYQDGLGKTSETDVYIMTSKGLLVCEVKNKGSEQYLFKISSDGQWGKYDRFENFIEPMESLFRQNARHCIATESILEEHGIEGVKIIPVVIIGNEYVRIDNHSKNAVIRASEIYNFVEQLELPEKYDKAAQDKILEVLNSCNVEEENFFQIYDLSEETIKKIWKILEFQSEFYHDRNELEDLMSKVYEHEKSKAIWIRIGIIIFEIAITIFMLINRFHHHWGGWRVGYVLGIFLTGSTIFFAREQIPEEIPERVWHRCWSKV